jgi:ABC-type nitrate/sulfonate/bicarbonate transport system ATPase subunit
MSTGKPISIRGVSKIYGSRSGESIDALLPIHFDVDASEFVVIVGPSGCGKSTLLYILAGLSSPTDGEVCVDGHRVTGPELDRGMVFQNYALFPWLNVIQNVEFGLKRKGVPNLQRRELAMTYLEAVGLKVFANRQIDELSGGMKQRVAIARTFAIEPSIILMDEPFGALDALTRRLLQRQLLEIWQKYRRTVVFITHSVGEAISLADRIIVMTARPGRIKSILKVELPHPRDSTTEGFRNYEKKLYSDLDEELAKSLA